MKKFESSAVAIVFLFSCSILKQSYADDSVFLVSGPREILIVDQSGEKTPFIPGWGKVRARGQEVFVLKGRKVSVHDTSGRRLREIRVPEEVRYFIDFLVLPNRQLAFLDNRNDSVYFIDSDGSFLKTVEFNESPDNHAQNMDGVVINDRLVLSENGYNQLVQIDLSTYETEIYRDLRELGGWLGAITYAKDKIYICQSRAIYAFSEASSKVKKVATLPEGNITGIAVQGDHAFVVVNGMSRITVQSLGEKFRTEKGALYKVHIGTGEISTVIEGLRYPGSICLHR